MGIGASDPVGTPVTVGVEEATGESDADGSGIEVEGS
jgi:hypothetical protein